jgi:hypothetical protein
MHNIFPFLVVCFLFIFYLIKCFSGAFCCRSRFQGYARKRSIFQKKTAGPVEVHLFSAFAGPAFGVSGFLFVLVSAFSFSDFCLSHWRHGNLSGHAFVQPSFGMRRTEVLCASFLGFIGIAFDGPGRRTVPPPLYSDGRRAGMLRRGGRENVCQFLQNELV